MHGKSQSFVPAYSAVFMAMIHWLVRPLVYVSLLLPSRQRFTGGTAADKYTAPSSSTKGTVNLFLFVFGFLSGGIVIVFVTLKLSKAGRFAFNVHERPVSVSYTALPLAGPLRYGRTPLPTGGGPSTVLVIGSR